MKDKKLDKWSMEMKCTANGFGMNGCGNNIVADKNTIFITDTCEAWTGDVVSCFAIECPFCGKLTIIQSDVIPKRVQSRIKMNDDVPSYMRVFRK